MISIHTHQVDGVEVEKEGLDLYEFAEVLIDFGAWQAAVSVLTVMHIVKSVILLLLCTQNLDGGGSSTSVYKGKVVDKPTCIDTREVCERPVTSITCIRNV